MVGIEPGEQGGEGSHESLELLHLSNVFLGEVDPPLSVVAILVQRTSFGKPGIKKRVDHVQVAPPYKYTVINQDTWRDNYLFTNDCLQTL